MKVALLDSVHPLLVERLRAAGHVCLVPPGHANGELTAELRDAQGIVVRNRIVDAGLISRSPMLKFIARAGSGMENIDVTACESRGIQLYNAPEGNRDGVGETCVMLLLMLLKHAADAMAGTRSGEWPREQHRGHELHGKTVGIIGFGNTGSAFAQRLLGFGVRILAYDKFKHGYAPPHVKEDTLEVVQQESDVISLHVPLNDETRHYMNSGFIAGMGKPFWLLNTSRGPVVDTRVLLAALDGGKILGAGLDVLEFERPDLSGLDKSQDPETLDRLLRHPHVVITPHIAGVTHEGGLKVANALADKILHDFPHGS